MSDLVIILMGVGLGFAISVIIAIAHYRSRIIWLEKEHARLVEAVLIREIKKFYDNDLDKMRKYVDDKKKYNAGVKLPDLPEE